MKRFMHMQEAYVRGGYRADQGAAKDVLVIGAQARNRAMHGDTGASDRSVVRIYPRVLRPIGPS